VPTDALSLDVSVGTIVSRSGESATSARVVSAMRVRIKTIRVFIGWWVMTPRMAENAYATISPRLHF
jgi:hypothetical protein